MTGGHRRSDFLRGVWRCFRHGCSGLASGAARGDDPSSASYLRIEGGSYRRAG